MIIEIPAKSIDGYLEITDTNKNILTVQFKSIGMAGGITDNIPNLKSIYIVAPSYMPSLNIGNKYYGIKAILDYAYSKDLSVITSVIYY